MLLEDRLTRELIGKFKKNLRSVLIYGSVIGDKEELSDLDMVVILKIKESSSNDIRTIRDILKNKEDKIDLQLLYEEELTNGDSFSLDTHGAFIIEELKNAIPLYGDNPFINLNPSVQMCKLSVIHKLQYYVFRARQSAMGYHFSTKDTSSDFHRKKIKMAMLDLLIAKKVKIKKSDDILKTFVKCYPNVVSQRFYELIAGRNSLEVYEALPLYEILYDQSLLWANKIYLEKRKPKVAKEKGIFFEYLLPEKTKDIPFIILCEGLPAKPCQDELMSALVKLGYGVIYPRYLGSWESEGIFLEKKPSEDISFLAKKLREGIILGEIKVVANNISLLATSFGASVALSTAQDKNINCIVALSPVLDFRNFSGLDSLRNSLEKMYFSVYRFNDSSWMNLELGKAVPSSLSVDNLCSSKIFLYGGGKDREISFEELKSWGKKTGIPTVIYENIGHLSFSKIEGDLLEDILNVLKSSLKYP